MTDKVFATPFEGSGNISVEKKDGHYAITQGGMPVADSEDADDIIEQLVNILTQVITGAHTHVMNLEEQLAAIRALNRGEQSGFMEGEI